MGVATAAGSAAAGTATAETTAPDNDSAFDGTEYNRYTTQELQQRYDRPAHVESLVSDFADPLLGRLSEDGYLESAEASALSLDELVTDGNSAPENGYTVQVLQRGDEETGQILTRVVGERGTVLFSAEPTRGTAHAVIPDAPGVEDDEYLLIEQTDDGTLSSKTTTYDCTNILCENSCNCVGFFYLNICSGQLEYKADLGWGGPQCANIIPGVDCSEACVGCCDDGCNPYNC